jgi:hypothetical protein
LREDKMKLTMIIIRAFIAVTLEPLAVALLIAFLQLLILLLPN